ncbi:MAG TPA: hypothetical protein VN193_14165 [Candidatus Angelobacter sp.]|jgi:hypothetical protein|nr:hypothetical protein [Candidatus Angelobacter sp.]
MKNPIREFLRRYDPDTIGEFTKISVGDAFYDPAKREEVAHRSGVVAIEHGPFVGVHLIRPDDDPPRRRWWQRQRDVGKDGAQTDVVASDVEKPGAATAQSAKSGDAD